MQSNKENATFSSCIMLLKEKTAKFTLYKDKLERVKYYHILRKASLGLFHTTVFVQIFSCFFHDTRKHETMHIVCNRP